jgi:integrase/recombinase XerD
VPVPKLLALRPFDRDHQVWKLTWRPSKTARSTGKILTIPILLSLQDALDGLPRESRAGGVLTFLVNDYGVAFASAAAFGNKFADWCEAAGLRPVLCEDGRVHNFRAHGLRKATLYTLYKAGGTVAELQAIGGHSSIAELQRTSRRSSRTSRSYPRWKGRRRPGQSEIRQ